MKLMRSRFRLISLLLTCVFLLTALVCTVTALKQAGVPFEHHVFPIGRHGLSLANEDWANGRFGEPYVMEQMMGIAEAVKNGEIKVPQEAMGFLNFFIHPEAVDTTSFPAGVPVKEVAVWPDLADVWMKENC